MTPLEQTEMFSEKPKPRRRKASAPVPEFKPKLVPRPKRPAPEGPVVMNLGVKHFINGTPYGPGPTEVPAHLVSAIRESEERNAAEENRLTKPRAVLITSGHRTREVDPSFFDDPNSSFGATAPAVIA